jgi:hypothetical protein
MVASSPNAGIYTAANDRIYVCPNFCSEIWQACRAPDSNPTYVHSFTRSLLLLIIGHGLCATATLLLLLLLLMLIIVNIVMVYMVYKFVMINVILLLIVVHIHLRPYIILLVY